MKMSEKFPDPDVLYALEPDEVGLRMLPVLMKWADQAPSSQLTLDNFLVTVIGDGRDFDGQYSAQSNRKVEIAIREAWAWLEGQALLIKDRLSSESNSVRRLSRRACQLADEPDPRKISTQRIPKAVLHARIREDVWALFHRGKFDTAVFEAMKAVEVAVREASGCPASKLGVTLMRDAFNPQNGPLADMNMEKAERESRSALFAGAIGAYKNPHSHRTVDLDDPDEAAEIIMLSNHLLRIVDTCRVMANGGSG